MIANKLECLFCGETFQTRVNAHQHIIAKHQDKLYKVTNYEVFDTDKKSKIEEKKTITEFVGLKESKKEEDENGSIRSD